MNSLLLPFVYRCISVSNLSDSERVNTISPIFYQIQNCDCVLFLALVVVPAPDRVDAGGSHLLRRLDDPERHDDREVRYSCLLAV